MTFACLSSVLHCLQSHNHDGGRPMGISRMLRRTAFPHDFDAQYVIALAGCVQSVIAAMRSTFPVCSLRLKLCSHVAVRGFTLHVPACCTHAWKCRLRCRPVCPSTLYEEEQQLRRAQEMGGIGGGAMGQERRRRNGRGHLMSGMPLGTRIA